MNKQEIEAAERAEVIQSVKALAIPFSLFVACCMMAAAMYLVWVREPLGYAFGAVSLLTIIAAITGLIRFQNKYRAKGMMPPQIAEEGLLDVEPTPVSDTETTAISTDSTDSTDSSKNSHVESAGHSSSVAQADATAQSKNEPDFAAQGVSESSLKKAATAGHDESVFDASPPQSSTNRLS